jgi:uncharacterized protein YdiU (UPF0061 family)
VGEWNLRALMVSLAPLVKTEELEKIMGHYSKFYTEHYLLLMTKKLGFDTHKDKDLDLIKHLLGTLQGLSVDYTLFFRTLSRYDGERREVLKLGLYHIPMNDWLDDYDIRLTENSSSIQERHVKMLKINPKYVLKNYILQEAIDAADKGDYSILNNIFKIAQDPYAEHEAFERWAGATPDEFKNKKLSCSS